jgi:hypothetical protein
MIYFNIPLSPIDRSSRQKNNNKKRILRIKWYLNQKDLIDFYRVFHPAAAQYIFFSESLGIFSKIDHNLEHKASLYKYKKIGIIPCILPYHNEVKLELNNQRNRKYSNTWRLSNMLLHDQWVIEEIRKDIKKFLESNENESNLLDSMGYSKDSAKSKVCSHKYLHWNTEKTSCNCGKVLSGRDDGGNLTNVLFGIVTLNPPCMRNIY